MTKEEVFAYISNTYRVCPDQPWEKYPENHVFRHADTGKWFALVMPVRADKLGLRETAPVEVITLKCDPMLIDVLSMQEGCHRAYHMNKTLWLTVELNDKVPEERVKDWIDLSFELTDKKAKSDKAVSKATGTRKKRAARKQQKEQQESSRKSSKEGSRKSGKEGSRRSSKEGSRKSSKESNRKSGK